MLDEELNAEFCKEVGIKQAACYLLNKETGEIRFYSNLTGLYKKPTGWKKIEGYKFDKPIYPDMINNPYNFSELINIQWNMFGEIGDAYKRNGDESFEYNYVKTRLTAMKMAKSFGGGELLDIYKKTIRETPFEYVGLEGAEQ